MDDARLSSAHKKGSPRMLMCKYSVGHKVNLIFNAVVSGTLPREVLQDVTEDAASTRQN